MTPLLTGVTLAESGRILPPNNTVAVRPYPFPYRAAFTVNNDADSMRHDVFEDWHAFVSGRKPTHYGDGLGLEIGDSFWIWATTAKLLAIHEQHPSATPRIDSQKLHRLTELGRMGWLDTLHGIGAWSDDYAPPRDTINYGLDRLAQLGIRPKVWVNHGSTASNIGCAPWAEGWYQKADTPGDPSYSMDLLRQFGFRYYWTDVCYELEKFGDHLDYGHPVVLERALYRYEWNHWRNRYKNFDLNDQATRRRFISFFNKTLTSMEANDGQPMYLFKRFRGTDLPSATTFAGQVAADRLDDLEAKRGVVIVYQHFGVTSLIGRGKRPGGATAVSVPTFDRHGVACWQDIAERQRLGRLFVTTTGRLLNYLWVQEHLKIEVAQKADCWIVTAGQIECPVMGPQNPSAEELNGLSFLVPESAPEIKVDAAGHPNLAFKRAPDPAYPGYHAVYLEWSPLEWPDLPG